MIGYIEGVVKRRCADRLVVMTASGVGYEIRVPLVLLAKMALNQEVELWVHTRVREDALELFGFADWAERVCFETVIQISGVGPKLGLSLLSHLDLSQLRRLLFQEDLEALCAVPGIGKRIAEKMMLELKRKIDDIPDYESDTHVSRPQKVRLAFDAPESVVEECHPLREDLKMALTQLGYKDKEVRAAVKHLEQASGDHNDLSLMVRQALDFLRKGAVVASVSQRDSIQGMQKIF
ncbi:MAG: Holliday junction branch migration protein RuvA [Zetaproteobacteria bacterium]|nr:Holliday junction branch migration protein RuvA [Zetaproteobacteria bacterium]